MPIENRAAWEIRSRLLKKAKKEKKLFITLGRQNTHYRMLSVFRDFFYPSIHGLCVFIRFRLAAEAFPL